MKTTPPTYHISLRSLMRSYCWWYFWTLCKAGIGFLNNPRLYGLIITPTVGDVIKKCCFSIARVCNHFCLVMPAGCRLHAQTLVSDWFRSWGLACSKPGPKPAQIQPHTLSLQMVNMSGLETDWGHCMGLQVICLLSKYSWRHFVFVIPRYGMADCFIFNQQNRSTQKSNVRRSKVIGD